MPPRKKRVANSNSEGPIVNLRRSTKAKVDIEAEVTKNVRDNERPRVIRIDPLDEAAADCWTGWPMMLVEVQVE